jgi:tRNA synthetases class I (C) catalytic domain
VAPRGHFNPWFFNFAARDLLLRCDFRPTHLSILVFRMNSFYATADVSNDTIADLSYTTPPTWVIQGRFTITLCEDKTTYLSKPRNYVTQDILRRIIPDYFGYDIHLVMNITGFDDKVDIPHNRISTSIEVNNHFDGKTNVPRR